MKAHIDKKRILVSEFDSHHSKYLGGIPGARKVKIYNLWSLPPSPFAAIRLFMWCKDKHIPLNTDQGVRQLLDEFKRIQESQTWKTDNGRNAWEKILSSHHLVDATVPTVTTPWNHQGCAYSFISDKTAWYLAMEMGTGKTLVAIMHILEKGIDRVLILCPKSVMQVWQDEWRKHAPNHGYDILTLDHGNSKTKAEAVKMRFGVCNAGGRKLIIIVNYDSARQAALAKELESHKYGLVVLDEAHKIKAAGGVTSRFCARLTRQARTRGCLSGTPLPNNLLDSYAQFRFLDPGLFGTNFARMRNSYAIMGGYDNREVVEFRNVDRFERLFNYITFRVDSDVLDLPPILYQRLYCNLSPTAARLYKELRKDFITQVCSGDVTASNALVKLLKFQQLTGGFLIDDEGNTNEVDEEKETLLFDLLDGTSAEEKVVVFCRFKHDLGSIQRVSDKLRRSYGELSGNRSDLQAGQFPDNKNILGVQIQAGGLGVNLSAARYAIFYSTGFSLSDYLQAVARVYRGGQDRTVTIYHLVSKGTVDEKVYQALEDKKKVIDSILESVKRGGDL